MAATPLSVIVIDDEPQMTKLLRLLLEEEMDCQVETFNDPLAALKRLHERPFDVISLDHKMPGMTGMALFDALRTAPGPNQDTPVLIFTGFLEEAQSTQSPAFKNLLFLEKPIEDQRYLRNIKIAHQMRVKGNTKPKEG